MKSTPKSPEAETEKFPRLQKYLAQLGYASRRTIEWWIEEGRIKINGNVATLGQSVKPNDKIILNGKLLESPKADTATRILIYHKMEGEICSNLPEGKRTVFANLPTISEGKWVMIGRLDVNTSGLLIFTNNGQLAHHFMHPSFEVEREYAVRVLGEVTDEIINRLKKGVTIDGERMHFKEIIPHEKRESANQWFTVILKEGKYHEVKRLWDSQNCTVSRLIRVRFGSILLPKTLRKGEWEELNQKQVQSLLALHHLSEWNVSQ